MKISEFLSEIFTFLVVEFLIYLNRHVFVMRCFGLLFLDIYYYADYAVIFS